LPGLTQVGSWRLVEGPASGGAPSGGANTGVEPACSFVPACDAVPAGSGAADARGVVPQPVNGIVARQRRAKRAAHTMLWYDEFMSEKVRDANKPSKFLLEIKPGAFVGGFFLFAVALRGRFLLPLGVIIVIIAAVVVIIGILRNIDVVQHHAQQGAAHFLHP